MATKLEAFCEHLGGFSFVSHSLQSFERINGWMDETKLQGE